MSREARDWAWDVDIQPTQKLILLALAERADPDGLCWPSLLQIEKKTGLSRRAITKNMKALEDQGYLSRIPGGPGRHTRYMLNLAGAPNALGNHVPYIDGESRALDREPRATDVGNHVPPIRHENRHNHNPLLSFHMTEDWQPDQEALISHLSMMGVHHSGIPPDAIGEFKSYWITRDDKHNQARWTQKLAKSIKHVIEKGKGGCHEGNRKSGARGSNAKAKTDHFSEIIYSETI